MDSWLDLFTVQTYEEFQKAGSKVSGFRERRWATCQQIKPGDRLLCYITGISRWVGILRVTAPASRASDRIWEMDVFPIRLSVEPEVLLPPEHGIPHRELVLTLPSSARAWGGYLRGSPTRVKKEDADVIAAAIQRAKETPVLRPYDKRKAERQLVPPRSSREEGDDGAERLKLCPALPTFSQAKGFLTAIEGLSTSEFGDLQTALWNMRGTPQEPVSWDDPDSWIAERLSGQQQGLAKQIWQKSGHHVNPRYMRGPMTLADRYGMVDKSGSGQWAVTGVGRDFLDSDFGAGLTRTLGNLG